MIDRAAFGEAIARTIDRLDKLIDAGDLDDSYTIGDVLVVAAFNRPYRGSNKNVEPDAIETLVLVDGTTQVLYVQEGLLRTASRIAGSVKLDDEEEPDD